MLSRIVFKILLIVVLILVAAPLLGLSHDFGKTGVYTEWSDSATRMCI